MFTGSALPFYRIERCALRAAGAIVASFQVMACFITYVGYLQTLVDICRWRSKK